MAWILFKKCYRSYLFSVIYQAAATAAALAKKYGADITVVGTFLDVPDVMCYRFFQKLNYRDDFLGTETFSGRFQGI